MRHLTAALISGALTLALLTGCATEQQRERSTYQGPARTALGREAPHGEMIVDTAEEEPQAWVFAYFKGKGADGLHLATSTDALTWTPVAGDRPLLAPELGSQKLMRDPSLARGPDGTYHLVWTVAENDRIFGHATSVDLVHWSAEEAVPVMADDPNVRNVWAPEVYYDEPSRQFLIVWSSTVKGRFPETAGSTEKEYNHRLYYTLTSDWQEFTPAQLFYDPGFSVIDGFIFRAGGQYVLVAKNETRYPEAAKNLFLASSRTLTGPYGPPSAPITPAGQWVEGPCALHVRGEYIVYYDRYMDDAYGAVLSANLARWADIGEQIKVPAGARHGTMLAVEPAVVTRLRQLESSESKVQSSK